METKTYTSSDIATMLKVSKRTAQRYIENLVNQENGKIIIKKDVLDLIITRHINDNQTTETRHTNNNEGITEFFSNEEYEEFKKRLIEYPVLKEMLKSSEDYINTLRNELNYHRSIYQKHLDIHGKLIDSIKERNFIEAKEKKLDI